MLYPIELRARAHILMLFVSIWGRYFGTIGNMNETLYLQFAPRLAKDVAKVKAALTEKGLPYRDLEGSPKDYSLVLFCLDMDSTEDEIYESAPWLKEQFDYSSLKGLRLMPFLLYHSSEGDIEDQVEENLAETIEAVFSGEFKPYGFDLDSPTPLGEFDTVLHNYEE